MICIWQMGAFNTSHDQNKATFLNAYNLQVYFHKIIWANFLFWMVHRWLPHYELSRLIQLLSLLVVIIYDRVTSSLMEQHSHAYTRRRYLNFNGWTFSEIWQGTLIPKFRHWVSPTYNHNAISHGMTRRQASMILVQLCFMSRMYTIIKL